MTGRLLDYLRTGIIILIALAAGFVGLAMLFGDLGPGETWASRIALIAGLHAGSGLIIGFLDPAHWKLAALAAWGAVVVGLGTLLGNLGRPVSDVLPGLVLFLPLVLCLAAAYAGYSLRRRFQNGRTGNENSKQ